jgi:AcrR family transcriptional regulator
MTGSLRERNKAAAMEKVRTVAFELMAEHGFDAVTVEQIATTTGVSPSTVYRYFGTKEALVLSIERPDSLVRRLEKDTSDRSALAAFERAANRVWGGDETAAIEIALVTANPALVERFERQLLDQRGPVAELFAQRRGKKSAGVKDEALAAAAIAILSTALLRWSGDAAELERLLAKSYLAIS